MSVPGSHCLQLWRFGAAGSVVVMNKSLRLGLGVLMVLMGSVFALQGFGLLKGSPMTGETLWAIVGPVLALAGVALILSGRRATS